MAKASKKNAPVLVDEVGEQPEAPAELGVDEAASEGPSVLVHSKLPEGFYRLGQRFTQEPRTFGPGELTEAQLSVLLAEKMLVVKVL